MQMKNMKDIDYRILAELLKNSNRSDRDLAKTLGVSQPTVTRRITALEKEQLWEYSVTPDFANLGYDILAFTFVRYNTTEYSKLGGSEKVGAVAREAVSENPSIIFASSGTGLGMTRITISVHKDYADYVKFKESVEKKVEPAIAQMGTFFVSLSSDKVIKKLGFKQLADDLPKSKP